MDEQEQLPSTGFNNPSPIYQESQGGKNAKWLWILIAIIIIAALVFAFVRGIGPFGKFKTASVSQSPSPASFVESPSPVASAAPSIDKSTLKVRILNGNGKAGVASAAKDFIEGKGYKVTNLGNADNYDFATTIVKLKDSVIAIKDTLVTDLSDKYSVTVSGTPLEASDSADIEVTVGAK